MLKHFGEGHHLVEVRHTFFLGFELQLLRVFLWLRYTFIKRLENHFEGIMKLHFSLDYKSYWDINILVQLVLGILIDSDRGIIRAPIHQVTHACVIGPKLCEIKLR